MLPSVSNQLLQYLTDEPAARWENNILVYPISRITPGLEANSVYFGHPVWGKNYLAACHRDAIFTERWQTVIGNWQDKIVVDIGCGPGNLGASLLGRCGTPRLLIGVDVSRGALEMAQETGYTTVLADAQELPFVDGFADIVTINASLHHCDDMAKMLAEAARIVKPGGLLITDHDPQLASSDYKGLGLLLWNFRLPLYLMLKRGGHATPEEQRWAQGTEIHHQPGDGITADLYYQTLEPLGFVVNLYPHNRSAGAGVLNGELGKLPLKCYVAQKLSGIKTNAAETAMLIFCVARRLE
jgi:SAM-dependent methyltransferase